MTDPADPASDRAITKAQTTSDPWARWLLQRRDGGDAALAAHVRSRVRRYVDRVLDAAQLAPGQTLVDVGCGEGVVGLTALQRTRASLAVVFTDVSAALLDVARQAAHARGVAAQCRFVQGAAHELAGIEDGSADVVAMRAVLAYVDDKAAALGECHRVLKPGGRLSIAEPIFRDDAMAAAALRHAIARQPAGALEALLPLVQRWKSAQFPDTAESIAASPIANFTERDLLGYAARAGFTQLHLELHIDVERMPATAWEAYLDTAPHPWAPPTRQVLAEQFSAAERALFERSLRPLVEGGQLEQTERVAYLSGIRRTS